MSQTPSPSPAASASAPQPSPSAPPQNTPETGRKPSNRLAWLKLALFATPVAIGVLLFILWIVDRRTHSITDDAFVESHIVNVAPEMVSGRLVRFLVDENDSVEQGQIIAEIDPEPYADRVNVSQAKLDSANAELKRQQADLERLRVEVPIQIEIARRTLAAAEADKAKAEEAVKLTRDEVEKGIEEARAGVAAAKADFVLADQEFGRFTTLFQQEAVPLRRSQEVTRARDAAQAHVDLGEARLAKAMASRTQIDIAQRTVEVAQRSVEKAAKGVDLALTGNDQIHMVELLVVVKRQQAAEASRGLDAAQHDLAYTRIRAPFSGVVVKRYRNLGDFASAGVAVVSMFNPDLLYVEANLEETRLPGVQPGNPVQIHIDAFPSPFRGRVVWINKSTGAQFALMPRNVVSGEFTKVVQRVAVRIAIERDDRWPQLRAGLSARVAIKHGAGDAAWAAEESRRLIDIEKRFNQAALVTSSAPAETSGPESP